MPKHTRQKKSHQDNVQASEEKYPPKINVNSFVQNWVYLQFTAGEPLAGMHLTPVQATTIISSNLNIKEKLSISAIICYTRK